MKSVIDLQIASETQNNIPTIEQFESWCNAAILGNKNELSIRIVNDPESQELNNAYRGKNYPTNVLSFESDLPGELNIPLLGDLVICKDVMEREAKEQGITLESHWAHLTVHGCLHLQGYDHIIEEEAEIMEALEAKILISLGYEDPYILEKE
ncbi:MAG: rRNA maturation RNase YbeY [Psittacicella sp.]